MRFGAVVAILGVAAAVSACDTASTPASPPAQSLTTGPATPSTSAGSTAPATSSAPATSGSPSKAAPTAPTSSAPAGGGACTTAEMPNGTWKQVVGSAGAGQVSADLAFQNTSGHSCVLTGFPQIALFTASGISLPAKVTQVDPGSAARLTVEPGGWVHSELRYSPDIPGPGEPQTGACEPDAASALVRLPGDTADAKAVLTPPTPVCVGGAIQAKAFAAGASSPAGG